MRLFSKKLKQVFISLTILVLILSGVWPGIGAGEVNAESKEDLFKTSAHFSRTVKGSASNVRFAAQDVQDMALTLTLKGDAKVRVIAGEQYVDEGASAIDGDGNDISDRITSNADEVDSLIPGVYTITYRILNDQGNDEMMTVERIVTVTPPAVTARGGIDTIAITEAMALAVIKLYDPSISDQVPLKTGQADENGQYQFRSFLYPGTYMVTQTVNGVESDRVQAKVLSPGEVDPNPGTPVDPGTPPVDDRPIAREDTYITFKNTILKGILTGFDPKGGTLTFVITEYGQKGIVKITNRSTGDFVYVPYPDETGTDFFTFKVNNGRQDSGEAKITIEIQDADGCPDTKIIYVKQGGAGTGCSWDDALSNLQDAIDKSEPGDQVWIAKGTYIPTGNQIGADPRTVHFKLKNGVTIYGGFAGNEDPETFDLAQRDFIVNETNLNGKIGPGEDESNHVYHVFYHDGGLDQTAVLDGVTITGGWASSSDPLFRYGGGMLNVFSSPTLMNVTISGNTSSIGGGIVNMSDSSPTLTNVTISGNTAGTGGGIANVSKSSPTLTNVTISGNEAGTGGGMANLSGSSPTLTNVTIIGNTAEGDGGGIANLSGSSPTLTNVTITGNTVEDDGGGIANLNGSNATILNSIVLGNGISDGQENNMYNSNSAPIIDFSLIGPPEVIAPNGIDPESVTVEALFIAPKLLGDAPTTEGDYRLNQGSPAINAGNNDLVPNGIETDLDDNPRRVGERVDLGAYEYQGEEAPVLKTIEVSGAGMVTIPSSSEPPKTETYNALVLDENDDAMPEEKVEWSVTATKGVSIDRETGVLTITDQAPAGPITVTATLVGNPAISGKMNVMLRAGSVEPPEPDTEAPQWPKDGELTVSDITQTSVKLSWPSATDNVGVKGYRVYVDGDEYTTVSTGKLETTVLGLEADKEYEFGVTAYDEAGNESAPLTKTAKTLPKPFEPDTEAPQWPKDGELTVSEITKTSVKLSWPSAADNVGVAGYRIYVDVDNWVPHTVSASVYECTVTSLRAGMTYTFTVKAFDDAGNESAPLSKQATTARSTGGGGRGGHALSNNADLADLQVWAEGKQLNLSPSFASGTTEYTARTEAEQVELLAKEAHSAAKVILNDKVMTDRVKVDLEEDKNTFVLTVQAENGTKKKYTLTIYREISKPIEPAIAFTDIAGHWAESYIKRATAKGIVSGYPDGTFKPNNPVTRAEFTVMLAGAMKLEGDVAELTFTDHDQIRTWEKQAVTLAVQAGIVDGYSDGSFRPNTHITRAEMAVMIARALKLQLNANASTGFADDEAIPQWAKGAVEAIHKLGIVDGRGSNQFVPRGMATRAEAVAMLLRILEYSSPHN